MTLSENDRVYVYDFDGTKYYGVLLKNTEYPHVSEYYIKYDDGQELAVLDMEQVYKED